MFLKRVPLLIGRCLGRSSGSVRVAKKGRNLQRIALYGAIPMFSTLNSLFNGALGIAYAESCAGTVGCGWPPASGIFCKCFSQNTFRRRLAEVSSRCRRHLKGSGMGTAFPGDSR